MAGFHGKIPSRGDFVSRGLSREVIAILDDWFQTGMIASKNALDKHWLAHYQVAPIWHYYLSPGIIDNNAWLGIWIPSIDKVGRSFPLTLLAPCEQQHQLSKMTQIAEFDSWLLNCEDLLLDALEADLDFDGFCLAVQQSQPFKNEVRSELKNEVKSEVKSALNAAVEPSAVRAPTVEASTVEASAMEQRLANIENALDKIAQHLQIDIGLSQAVAALKPPVYNSFEYGINLAHSPIVLESCLISARQEPFCLWLSEGNEAIAKQWVVTNGLPSSSEFGQFLMGFE